MTPEQIELNLRAHFEAELPGQIDRYRKSRVHEIIPNGFFASASSECRNLYVAGEFYGCITLAQSVAEGLAKFIAEKNGIGVVVNNIVIRPDVDKPVHAKPYWSVLTRIISATVTWNDDQFELKPDRSIAESKQGAFKRIREHVGASINPSAAKDTKPIDPAEVEEIDAETNAVAAEEEPESSAE